MIILLTYMTIHIALIILLYYVFKTTRIKWLFKLCFYMVLIVVPVMFWIIFFQLATDSADKKSFWNRYIGILQIKSNKL